MRLLVPRRDDIVPPRAGVQPHALVPVRPAVAAAHRPAALEQVRIVGHDLVGANPDYVTAVSVKQLAQVEVCSSARRLEQQPELGELCYRWARDMPQAEVGPNCRAHKPGDQERCRQEGYRHREICEGHVGCTQA